MGLSWLNTRQRTRGALVAGLGMVALRAFAAAPVVSDGGSAALGERLDGGTTWAESTAEAVEAELAKQVATVAPTTWTAVGKPPWMFRYGELRHYAQGRFWGPDATRAAVSKTDPDPLKAILAYHAMLRRAGVKLLVLPIPGKVLLYGDELVPPIDGSVLEPTRAEFLKVLTEHGIQVIDFLPDMKKLRAAGRLAYLPRDSHWSTAAVHRAAQVLGRMIRGESWYRAPLPRPTVTDVSETVQGYPDLASWRDLYQRNRVPPKSEIAVHHVKVDGGYVELDRQSPVLLVGDSSTLVFHSVLVNEHGGLSDHLAAELGFPVDSVGLAGEEAVSNSWIALARRHDNLAGKKVVVFCFGERSLTGQPHGWPIVPVYRPGALAPPLDAGSDQ